MAAAPMIRPGDGFAEVGDRCWMARYEYLDVNVGVVAGQRGLVVVDTHASEADARVVVEQLRRHLDEPVVAVVNTHAHFDHFLGNAVFRDEYVDAELLAHESAAPAMREHAGQVAQRLGPDDPRREQIATSRVVVPQQTFSSARVVDLGDRLVEVVHPGRGHTAGDCVVCVPDAGVVYAGDLVEQSTLDDGVPGFGDDCFPLEWPATLDVVLGMLTGGSVVVPGHGRPVDRGFVEEQRGSIGVLAEMIRDLAGRGVSVDEALGAGTWPYPAGHLKHAVQRGYEHLPRASRSLPLI